MNAGYVRLSRDDDKRNYISIENQKLIIRQCADSQNIVIDRWYEDDGFSGYRFDRPGFIQLMNDLDKDIDSVFVKDFSRLGRHNAKVLLLLDEFLEREKRLVVIDDNYDSLTPDDDVIGIKTWYNEKYVKDTSKKIKRVLAARQKEGTLLSHVPFGYKRNDENREVIEIVPKEAEHVKMIFNLYIQGSGYRKVAAYLTEHHTPTPSMILHEKELSQGRYSSRQIALEWSDGMVKDMLGNDFYAGTYRLHKRARTTVHGKDKRVPMDEQYTFENHHPAIIDKMTFELIQDIKAKRVTSNYRGSRSELSRTEIPPPFGSCLFCKGCGKRLTPIVRKSNNNVRKYYICSTYNTKGKLFCPKAHLIEEKDLMEDIINFIRLCRNSLLETIATYEQKDFESDKKSAEEKYTVLQGLIQGQKKQLKTLLSQKIKDLTVDENHTDIITESYETLQTDILAHIKSLESQLQELDNTKQTSPKVVQKSITALNVLDGILKKRKLNRTDIELLIARIEVDENGLPCIGLKHGFSGFLQYSPAEELNRSQNDIIYTTLKSIHEDDREFTSAKYLSAKLMEAGYQKSKKSVLPYIGLLIKKEILKPSENPLKPYSVVKSKDEIKAFMASIK